MELVVGDDYFAMLVTMSKSELHQILPPILKPQLQIFMSRPLNPTILDIVDFGGFYIRRGIPNNAVIKLIRTHLNPHGCVDLRG
jgi:hypothetical protein